MQDLINGLFIKYLDGSATEAEVRELFRYIQSDKYSEVLAKLLQDHFDHPNIEALYQSIDHESRIQQALVNIHIQISDEHQSKPLSIPQKTLGLWPKLIVAASLFIVIGVIFRIYRQRDQITDTKSKTAINIKPGGNKAILTLDNGKTIILSDADTGKLAKEAGVEISKTAGGQIIYTVLNPGLHQNTKKEHFNTIETPRGGQYQVRLPDGSKVWLNAESKLVYPVSLASNMQRRVKLTGEAYFLVAKDKAHPFIVSSAGQEVRVLGTHFNINAYANEPDTKTTLLEGRVAVRDPRTNKDGVILRPGQQAVALPDGSSIKVRNVNTDEAVAWKSGLFFFKKADIQMVMRELSRWYDVEVSYQGKLPRHQFNGSIHRDLNLADMLDVLSNYYNVPFKVDGRKIIVGDK